MSVPGILIIIGYLVSCGQTVRKNYYAVDGLGFSEYVSATRMSDGPSVLSNADKQDSDVLSKVYPWSQRGRDFTTSSSTSYSGPSDFSVGPSWVWPNPLDEQVRHSPLIDDDMNIYVTTATRMRKFNSNG